MQRFGASAAAAVVLGIAALGIAGCYAHHEPPARGEADSPDDASTTDGGHPAELRTQCERWCDHRATTHAVDGFCPPSLTGRTSGRADGCGPVCVAAHDTLPAERIETCIRDYALCHQTLDGCAGR